MQSMPNVTGVTDILSMRDSNAGRAGLSY